MTPLSVTSVLLHDQNEVTLATRACERKDPFLVPLVFIRIEGPVGVVDKVVDRNGTRQAAKALAAICSQKRRR